MSLTASKELSESTEFPDLVGKASAKSVLRSKRGVSASLTESLGAIALSVAIIGALGFAVGAAFNYGQDSTAKGTLESIKSAQVLVQSKTGTFGTKDALTVPSENETAALTAATGDWNVNVSDDGRNYCAAIKSGSMFGPTYWITAKGGKVVETAPTTADLGAGLTCPSPTTP